MFVNISGSIPSVALGAWIRILGSQCWHTGSFANSATNVSSEEVGCDNCGRQHCKVTLRLVTIDVRICENKQA
eukprot:739102-Amphidinium_carterae.1